MDVLLFAKTALNLSETLRVQSNMGTHLLQGLRVAKTILVDCLVNNRHAIRLRQKDCKWLLPIGHKSWMNIGLQGNCRGRWTIAKETNAFVVNFKAQLHL